MNITFLVGNGFDLNLGLRTRYVDFYPYFMANAQDDNMIRNWLGGDNLLWADLETKLGESLTKLNVNDIEKFYKDKEELDELLLEYLEKEEAQFAQYINGKAIVEEFSRSIIHFKCGLSEIDDELIEETCRGHIGEDYAYQFISFNYTDLLDRFISMVCQHRSEMLLEEKDVRKHHLTNHVLHVHGTLEREMILGVNDPSQVNNTFLSGNKEFLDIFIKERLNRNLGQRRTENAKKLIDESDIICIFGMSIGCTDRMWWEKIMDWLHAAINHKLIVYYKDGCIRSSSQRMIRAKREVKNKLADNMKKLNLGFTGIEGMKNEICVSYNPDIFNFQYECKKDNPSP